MRFTRRGYIRLRQGARFISQHTQAEEAYERAYTDAETNEDPLNDGIYTVEYPNREIDLSSLRKVRISFSWSSTPALLFQVGTALSVNLSTYVSNPQAKTLTYAVVGSLPTGVTLVGPVVFYDGTSPAATASVQFTVTDGTWTATSSALTATIVAYVDTVAPTWPATPPAIFTFSNVTQTSMTVSWRPATDNIGVVSYVLERSTDNFNVPSATVQVYSGANTSFSDGTTGTPLSMGTLYYYRCRAYDARSNASLWAVGATTTMTQAGAAILWQDGFESGSGSAWSPFSIGGMTYSNDGQAYNGSYYAKRAITNGTTNDFGLYKVYGTSGNLGSQIRDFYAQFSYSLDSFTGSYPATQEKVIIFQYHDTVGGYTNIDSNGTRLYQVMVALTGTGQYAVYLVRWNPAAAGAFVKQAWLLQNSTSYTPSSSFGAWDTLRLRVQLDTNGSGALGAGQGNGIVQLWRNNQLIVDYSNVNLVDANATVGMGRIMLSTAGDTWTGSSTTAYYDRIQVASGAGALDTMPATAKSRAGPTQVLNVGFDSNPGAIAHGTIIQGSRGSLRVSSYNGSPTTVDWVSGAEAWNGGGCIRFALPSTSTGGERYRSLIPQTVQAGGNYPNRLNLRYLFKWTAGYTATGYKGDFFYIRGERIWPQMNPMGNPTTGLPYGGYQLQQSYGGTRFRIHGNGLACGYGGYEIAGCDADSDPSPADRPFNYSEWTGQWVCFENALTNEGDWKMYIWTRDRTYNGLYMHCWNVGNSGSTAPCEVGGDGFGGFTLTGGVVPAGNYGYLDEVVMADGLIGPPGGF